MKEWMFDIELGHLCPGLALPFLLPPTSIKAVYLLLSWIPLGKTGLMNFRVPKKFKCMILLHYTLKSMYNATASCILMLPSPYFSLLIIFCFHIKKSILLIDCKLPKGKDMSVPFSIVSQCLLESFACGDTQ